MALTGQTRSCPNLDKKLKAQKVEISIGNLGKYKNIVQDSRDKAREAVAKCN